MSEDIGQQTAKTHLVTAANTWKSPWVLRLVILLCAFGFVYLSLSPGFIRGDGDYWQRPEGDAARCEIGWMYYAHDQWRLPIFAIGNYHEPEGSNVYLSDSLPLFALPAKVVFKTTGWLPTYTGFWVALCFFLQVICASRLLTAIGIRSLPQHLAGVVLLAYMPAFFLRFGHMTLLAHFFVLAELEGYVRAKRDGLQRRGWFWVCALPIIAILVQPYIAAMALLLALVTIIDQWRAGRLSWRGVAARLAAIGGAALVVILAGGFVFANTHPHNDYGLYSLNLLSPFVPFAETRLGASLGTSTPTIPGIDQWEGGCYLGAGVLFLLLLCIPCWRGAGAAVRRHAVLLIALLAATLFAITGRVGLGAHEVLNMPLPAVLESTLSAFRGSGRFGWLAMYATVVAAVAIVARHYSLRTATVILLLAAVLQWTDVRPMQPGRRAASAASAASTINDAQWQRLIAAHQKIFEYPSFECGGLFGEDISGSNYREMEIDLIAARLNKPTNSSYPARFTRNCAQERETAGRNMGKRGTLYLYRSSEDVGAYLGKLGQNISRCALLDDVVVCSATADLSTLR
jgi:Family of unknown function (DUF6311)